MRIQISKPTPIANAPDELCYAINKWTDHEAFVSNDPDAVADIVHCNNAYLDTFKPSVIQYHSEPGWPGVDLDAPCRKLIIAQYHATLPEYKDCTVVRNVINFDRPEYAYKPVEGLRIAYSPSSKVKVGQWHDKSYNETVKALESYDADIITDVPLSECLRRKNNCSVVIDECVTGSYHRSALEGLAMGKVVVCRLSKQVDAIALNASGGALPMINRKLSDLPNVLKCLEVLWQPKSGYENRLWMIKHWHPKDIAEEFIKIYEEVLNVNS